MYSRHASYRKYYYSEIIDILRVRCLCCGTTHAVIPSFSLPGTSIGTEEAEEYLKNRVRNKSRKESAKVLLDKGFGYEYLKSLEKLLHRCVNNGKALFSGTGNPELWGLAWISSITGKKERPLYAMNLYCIFAGYNPVFCSRSSILLFRKRKAGRCISHNNTSAHDKYALVDSS